MRGAERKDGVDEDSQEKTMDGSEADRERCQAKTARWTRELYIVVGDPHSQRPGYP